MGTAGYQQIISIGTHKGNVLKFGPEIVYVDCEIEGGQDGVLEHTFLEGSRWANHWPFTHTLAVRFMYQEHSHSEATGYTDLHRLGTPIFTDWVHRSSPTGYTDLHRQGTPIFTDRVHRSSPTGYTDLHRQGTPIFTDWVHRSSSGVRSPKHNCMPKNVATACRRWVD